MRSVGTKSIGLGMRTTHRHSQHTHTTHRACHTYHIKVAHSTIQPPAVVDQPMQHKMNIGIHSFSRLNHITLAHLKSQVQLHHHLLGRWSTTLSYIRLYVPGWWWMHTQHNTSSCAAEWQYRLRTEPPRQGVCAISCVCCQWEGRLAEQDCGAKWH